jgi:hypothetical protein
MKPEHKDEAIRNQVVGAKSPGTAGGVDTVYAIKHPGSGGGVDTKSADFAAGKIIEPGVVYEAETPGGTAGTNTLTEVEVEASGPRNEGPELI